MLNAIKRYHRPKRTVPILLLLICAALICFTLATGVLH